MKSFCGRVIKSLTIIWWFQFSNNDYTCSYIRVKMLEGGIAKSHPVLKARVGKWCTVYKVRVTNSQTFLPQTMLPPSPKIMTTPLGTYRLLTIINYFAPVWRCCKNIDSDMFKVGIKICNEKTIL